MPEPALRVRASLDYPDMVVHTHSPKIWEAEVGGYIVSSRPAVLWSETLSQKTNGKEKMIISCIVELVAAHTCLGASRLTSLVLLLRLMLLPGKVTVCSKYR